MALNIKNIQKLPKTTVLFFRYFSVDFSYG